MTDTVCVCHRLSVCFFYRQSVSVTDRLCLSQTVCVCHKLPVSVTGSLCLSQTVCVCHRRLCLSQTIFVRHRQSVSVTDTPLDHSWPGFCLFIHDFHQYLSVRLKFVRHLNTTNTNFVDPWGGEGGHKDNSLSTRD